MTNEERQQAIEWLKGRPIMMAGAKRMYDLAVEALEAYVPDMNVGNMISKQAAMERLMAQNVIMDGSEYHNGFNAGVNRAQEVIRNLPPVQPKRTCVNCGRTVNNGGWYADGGTRCPIEEHYALPKDGYCHLWEKRNVTDDDYPEGRADE